MMPRLRTEQVEDVRVLLGMHSLGARVLVAFFGVTFVLMAYETRAGLIHLWPAFVAVAIVTAGAVTLISVAGDPLPIRYTVLLTCAGPVSLSAVLLVARVPVTNPQLTWPLGAATAIYTFMCVRGRTEWAWFGMVGLILTCMIWSHLTGQGAAHGFAVSAINVAPVAMSTYFAFTIRPAARTIFALRRQSTKQVAAQAAADAVLDERDRQLDRLDELARPLLEHIAVGAQLDAEELMACTLLEAHLRDTLRAPALVSAGVAAATRNARSRGVDVILLDDGGLEAVPPEERDKLLERVERELTEISAGSITVRVQPPGRRGLVTILASRGEDVVRIELGGDGRVLEPATP